MASEIDKAPSVAQSAELAEQQGYAPEIEQLGKLVSSILSTVSLGHQTGPHAYAGEDFGRYLREATSDCRTILRMLPTLAATGNQQVGEVQGDAWALARELRAAMYEADGRFGMADLIRKGHIKDAECGINVLAAALAARQPGAQGPKFTTEDGPCWHHAGKAFIVTVDGDTLQLMVTGGPRIEFIGDARPFRVPAQGIDLGQLPLLPKKVVIDIHLPSGVRIYGYTAEQMQDYARAALAARQPVETQLGYTLSDVHEAYSRGKRDAARQPGAQEPVGVVDDGVMTRSPRDLPGEGRYISAVKMSCELPPGTKLYAAPSAQGIDLGQFRQALESWKRKRERSLRNAIEAGKGNQLVEGLRRNLEEADRLLALIDQRDAAPGPRISQGTHDPSGVGNG